MEAVKIGAEAMQVSKETAEGAENRRTGRKPQKVMVGTLNRHHHCHMQTSPPWVQPSGDLLLVGEKLGPSTLAE